MLYEALMLPLALAVSLISFGVTFALNMPNMTLPLFLLLLVVDLYPKHGKSEMNNKMPTPGVIALLEVAKARRCATVARCASRSLTAAHRGSKGASA